MTADSEIQAGETEEIASRALSFGAGAEQYHQCRPGYPVAAATWLDPQAKAEVLELGAGTGKFTASLVDAGFRVHATDADARMLEVLRNELPSVTASVSAAEHIKSPEDTYDLAIAAQSMHLFDTAEAFEEICRVLRPGGRFAVVSNDWDLRVPWVRRLSALIEDITSEPATQGAEESLSGVGVAVEDLPQYLSDSLRFVMPETATFKHWHPINRRGIAQLVRSWSSVATRDSDEQNRIVDEVLGFYDTYGRGSAGMQLPYVTTVVAARAVQRRVPRTAAPAASDSADTAPAGPSESRAHEIDALTDSGVWGPFPGPPSDTGELLIDFR